MREVTQGQFYEMIGQLDVTSSVVGKYPYTHDFYLRNNRYDVIGRIVGYIPDGSALVKNKYYLK